MHAPDIPQCRICLAPRSNGQSVVVQGATLDVQHERFTVWRCVGCGTLNALEPVAYERIYRNYPIQRQRYDGFARLMFAMRLRIRRQAGLRSGQRALRALPAGAGWQCAGYDPDIPRHDDPATLQQPLHRFVLARAEAARFFSPAGWRLVALIDACYIDTPVPFANTMFLFHLFDSGDGMMDFAFGDLPAWHIIRHPALLFWGLFGRWFARRQDLFAVMERV